MLDQASVAQRQAEGGDGHDEGEGADEVDGAADHRDAVGVGVDAEADRRDGAVVRDDEHDDHGGQAGEERRGDQLAEAGRLLAEGSGHEVGAGAVEDVHGHAERRRRTRGRGGPAGTAPRSAGARPRRSLLDSRPDRIPPRAPELDSWAGTRIRSAGSAAEGDELTLEGDARQAAHQPREQQHGDGGAHDALELGEVGARAQHQGGDGDARPGSSRGSVVTSPSPSSPVAR